MVRLAVVFLMAAAGEPIVFRDQAVVDGDYVRLADVADLSGLPPGLREAAAATPVARVVAVEQRLSSHVAAQRARASLPALADWLAEDEDETWISIRAPSSRIPVERPSPPGAASAANAAPPIRRGERLTLSVEVGRVVVEREVWAVQDGAAGLPLFVRTDDGVLLTAQWSQIR